MDVCESVGFVSVGNMLDFGGIGWIVIGSTVMSKSNPSLTCDILLYISTLACKSAIMYLIKNDPYVQINAHVLAQLSSPDMI